MRRALATLLVACVLSTGSARADAPIDVDVSGCPGLDVALVERTLALELPSELGPRRPRIALVCAETQVEIRLVDPLTDKSLARTLPLTGPPDARALAIASAELVIASWAELLLAPSEDAPPPPADAAPAIARARDEVRSRATVIESTRPSLRLGATVHGRIRDFAAPIPSAGATLFAGWLLDAVPLELGLVVGGEWGRTERVRGTIDVAIFGAGLTARARLEIDPAIAIVPALRTSYAYVLLAASVDVAAHGAARSARRRWRLQRTSRSRSARARSRSRSPSSSARWRGRPKERSPAR